MPVVTEILLDPGAEYDFTTDEGTTVSVYTAGTWNGTAPDHTILDSEDGITQASVTIPADIHVSYCDISNLAVTGPFKIYADFTCTNGGNNNGNVIFTPDSILIGGIWKDVAEEYVLVTGAWVLAAERNVLVGTWKQ
jgi:hypothetical protein